MKWLVRDCRELETVGIQGDETDVAGQRSLISWVCARLKSAKIFVVVWSEGMEVWKPQKQQKRGEKDGNVHGECSITLLGTYQ